MAYMAGGETARYVYDDTGRRISAEFSYADGTNRGQSGENIASDTSVNQTDKIWYRSSALDSTLYAVDETGDVISHVIYDEWGKPLTVTDLDLNYSGIDNINNYTGYTYDEVLGLYFAQNRFYDPENHRFTQEDIVKDGSNWYAYCGNSPVVSVDPLGLYDAEQVTIERDGKKLTATKGRNGNITIEGGFKLGDILIGKRVKSIYNVENRWQEMVPAQSLLKRYYLEEKNVDMYVRFYLDARDSQIDPVFKMRLAAFARDYGVIIYSWDGLRDPGDANYSRGSAHTYGMAVDAHASVASDSDYFKNISCEQQKKDREYEKNHNLISNKEFENIDAYVKVAKQTTLLKYGLCKPWNDRNKHEGIMEYWHIQPIETIPAAERNTTGGVGYPTAHTKDNLEPFYDGYQVKN